MRMLTSRWKRRRSLWKEPISLRIQGVSMLIILQDAERSPKPFQWFGAIPRSEIEEWLRRERLALPPDLIELWGITGGGDVFEETILRPTVRSVPNRGYVEDDIESANARHAAAGNPQGLYIFMDGAFLSAVRLRDQEFVTLTRNYVVENSFPSLDEWYIKTLRAEFGDRYGLSSASTLR
jgi:hypothetical protein